MKSLTLFKDGKTLSYQLPTSLDEISVNYLNDITDDVAIADNYSLIALVRHDSLKAIIMASHTKKKDATTGVIPIFIKHGNTDNNFIKSIHTKDIIIAAPTELSLGHHVVSKTALNIQKFCNNIDKFLTPESYSSIISDKNDKEVFFLEFKLVPNCDIHGVYEHTKTIDDTLNDKYLTIK